MKRKELYQLIAPLSERLFRYAYILIPDDLQAEQLVIDGVNAFLLKEGKKILQRELDVLDKKQMTLLRRSCLKGILRFISEIGVRRSLQLQEVMKDMRPQGFDAFYSLGPKGRLCLGLRYEAQLSVAEIEDILQIPRYEVIEKLHNGRHLLTHNVGSNTVL